MEKNRLLFQLGFLIVVLLALGLAFLRTTSYSPASGPSGPSAQERAAQAERRSIETLKKEEILGMDADENPVLTKEQKRALAVQRYMRRPDFSLNANDYTLDPSVAGRNPYASLPGTSVGDSSSGSYRAKGLSAADYGKYGGGSGSYAGDGASGAVSQRPGVYRQSAQERMQAERERSFSPFMAAMNKEQHKKLESQLKGLSSGIDRAIAKALLPKSKKDANIEKYLQRNASPEAAAAGPFAPVLEQVAAQKAGVVSSMGQAFGPQAAQEAGKVMNDFQSEMNAAVTAPGQTPQQIADKVKAVTKKYEQKLQKMTEDNGFRQFEQERLAKDNLLKQELSKQYGADFAALAGEKIDAAREKDMLLAQQGLPAEEYYKQQLANQRERRKALEDLIAQSGKSAKGLFAAEDEVERQDVEKKLKDEEEGKTLGRSYKAGEKELAAINHSLNQERNEKLRTAGEVYGEEGARRVDGIYQKYYDEYMKIWNDPDSSKTSKQQASMKLRQEVNRQLEQVQNEPQMRQARLERQVESSMEQLMKDPGVSRASPAQKAALEEKARPVLREMYERVNDILASNLPDAEKQRRIEAVQAQAQRKLSSQ